MHCRSQQVSTQPLVCQPLYERGRVLNGCSRPKALGTAGVDHSFGNHCELILAVTRYGMLQSNFMQYTEHATAMSIPFVCALVCTSLLYDIKSCQDSDVVLPLKPSVSNICHVCFATTYYPTLQTSWTSNVTECSIAQSSSKCKLK